MQAAATVKTKWEDNYVWRAFFVEKIAPSIALQNGGFAANKANVQSTHCDC